MANFNDLVGLEVVHKPSVSFRKSFGIGTITEVKDTDNGNAKLTVVFTKELTSEKSDKVSEEKKTKVKKKGLKNQECLKEPVSKLFMYPLCFTGYLEFTKDVSDEIESMIDCDIEVYQDRIRLEKEELQRSAEARTVRQKEFNCIALKRPYVDSAYGCTSIQMKNNVNSKYTFCQGCDCKKCISGEMSYEEVSKSYNEEGGCPELLIPTTFKFQMSSRNKVENGDLILFTCIPKDSKEQDRFVYGCGVVEKVVGYDTYNEISLNEDLSYFVDYEVAANNKFWDIMLNLNKPSVMLFGNSHCRKIKDNQQMAQYVKMLFKGSVNEIEEDEIQVKYEALLSYIGLIEDDIEENKGALVLAAKQEKKVNEKSKEIGLKDLESEEEESYLDTEDEEEDSDLDMDEPFSYDEEEDE